MLQIRPYRRDAHRHFDSLRNNDRRKIYSLLYISETVCYNELTKAHTYKAIEQEYRDGVVYEDENIRVTALHNTHLKENAETGWHSYSFLIEAEGKRIVYSGDVGFPEELDEYIAKGCDALIMETGHHKVSGFCSYAKEKNVKRLYFTHHGREILQDVGAAERYIAQCDIAASICRDGDVATL